MPYELLDMQSGFADSCSCLLVPARMGWKCLIVVGTTQYLRNAAAVCAGLRSWKHARPNFTNEHAAHSAA